jgi:potassium-transporting ATPase KdpC subunit
MRREIVTSAIGIVVLTVLLGLAYPLLITGVSQVAFPGNANGQKVYVNGELVGSKIIGQSFARHPSYFQSRPSATEGGAYNAAASAFSNRGPNDEITKEEDEANIEEYLELNKPYFPGLSAAQIPVDAVNTSASNLDPEISPANARIQARRVAAKRGLSLSVVDGVVAKYTDSRGLGFSGEPGVNVLELNLALDRLKGAQAR